ncbi:hypothetical protein EZV62_020744 [Acer yangbiense]|uniref:DOMON domain-containing protein n=1 Tax=Acer yangbiense TaxID=1000413 RepID=A0A5C7HFI0_9ROSI|nr:hypothetical protein EZV62_020744 [Acer yangbiense]
MERVSKSALFCSVLVALFLTSYAQQNCGSLTFENNKQYATCNNLPVLSSSIHWTYNSSTNIVDLAFRKTGTSSSNWVAWALNPSGKSMAGSQCLVAYQSSSGNIRAYTSQLGSTPQLVEGNLSFQVPSITAMLTGGDVMTIYATLQLNSDLLSTNQLWQEGPLSGGAPGQHPLTADNTASVGTIDFRTGETTASSGSDFNSRLRKRNVLEGWATGIKLGNDNPTTLSEIHRNVGIALFALGTLQVFALLLRPKPDHKYRFYWNIYHHLTGYTVIGLSIYNVLKGLSILGRGHDDWWWAYVGTLIGLGSLSALLEAVTWFIVIKRKKESREKLPHSMNGANGHGHGAL